MSVWDIQEPQNTTRYAQSIIIAGPEISGRDGTTWQHMDIQLVPIEQSMQIQSYNQPSFSISFQTVIIPSVMTLVQAGKIKSPDDMFNNQFVAYRLKEYKDNTAKTIKWYKEQDRADELLTDDKGKKYKLKDTVEFLDVFATQEAWEKAANIPEQAVPPVASVVSTDNQENDELIKSLPVIINASGTNITMLKQFLSTPQYNAYSIEHPTIKSLVAKMIVEKCGSEPVKQLAMLMEINSHFDDANPYLMPDHPEMVSAINDDEITSVAINDDEEIAF